tara:strand:- start:2314 stop:2679 length:366 start_codon:yes stop_codon:yes gene_type:complete
MNNIWEQRLKKYMDSKYHEDVLELYKDCFDYSPYLELDEIMAFVTECFIERNKDLSHPRTIAQVKMKWGYLTIYYDGGPEPFLDEIVRMAENLSIDISKEVWARHRKGGLANRTVFHTTEN